jgi:hypothetical protein
MTDEIFESLRGRFKQQKCPTSLAGDRITRAHYPEINGKNCDCDDVIHTGQYSCGHTFNFSSLMVAKVGTVCQKFRFNFTDWLRTPDYECQTTTERFVARLVAKDFREMIKQAGAREAEFLAYADMPNFNKGCVNIRGVPFERKELRKALMYQDKQVFDIKVVTYRDEIPLEMRDRCSSLHLIGDKHHIVLNSQSTYDGEGKIGVTSIGYN